MQVRVNGPRFSWQLYINYNTLCRRRTLVAIGTHDLDTLKGPFTYNALPPKDIRFKPLNQRSKFDGEELMTLYEVMLILHS